MRRKIESLLHTQAKLRLERAPFDARAKACEEEAAQLGPLREEVSRLQPLAAQVPSLLEDIVKLKREATDGWQTWQRTEELFEETCAERYGEVELLHAQVGDLQVPS
jgi:hypothetical protein